MASYGLIEAIHHGDWADVYVARHSYLDRWAAVQLRVLGADPCEEPAARLRQKGRLLASFCHPHLPVCHDAGESEGTIYLAMEWIQGQDLAMMARRAPLSPTAGVGFVCQAARALDYAHHRGVVHRDVTPAHLLADHDEQIRVMGWSRSLRLGDTSLLGFEQRGQLIGDPDYMSPEQIDDCRRVDPRADIYSLGCTLYFILTGRVVFPAAGPQNKAAAHQRQPPPSLRENCPGVPEQLEAVFWKMTAKAREERFSRMEEVVAALEPLG